MIMVSNDMLNTMLAIVGLALIVASLPAVQNSITAGNMFAIFTPTFIVGLLLLLAAIKLSR